jgi:SAM-dependent methyltransferase
VSGEAEPELGFEEIYRQAGDDLGAIPWASLTPHPALLAWIELQPDARERDALVVGCGLGDDAEALSDRGYRVSAFDIAPTAIARCRRRFPDSRVQYRVADLFALPEAWRGRFDLVVEIRTLQSLAPEQRPAAAAAIASTVRPGGLVWVRCLGRQDAEAFTRRPWPVSRSELHGLQAAGLRELEFHEELPAAGRGRFFTAVYGRDVQP